MPPVRTQDKRHWIQVETKIDGGEDSIQQAFIHLDLNQVEKAIFARSRDDHNVVNGALIIYAGAMKAVTIEGDAATFFYEQWQQFVTLHAQQEFVPPETSNIITVGKVF